MNNSQLTRAIKLRYDSITSQKYTTSILTCKIILVHVQLKRRIIFGWVSMTIISHQTINFKIVISFLPQFQYICLSCFLNRFLVLPQIVKFAFCLKLPLKGIRIQNVTYHFRFYYNLLLLVVPQHFHTLFYTTHHLLQAFTLFI